jgi:16S rRNA (cytidine1402-2'-O)-methyltransferase
MSTLYLVATPIGNLEDISARALRILREVTLIACEDTRHSGKLLSHYDIHTPTTSYYEFNKKKKLDHVLAALHKGDVALISDAGTPGLNDPGFLLVRAAIDAGHTVSPIPGPSASLAALVSSGLPTDAFLYLGYLPRRSSERVSALQQVADLPYTLIWLETPHRLLESLTEMKQVLGERQIAVAGELTKMYEEIFRGGMQQAAEHFSHYPARGEYTLVVAGQTEKTEKWDEAKLESVLVYELGTGEPLSNIAKDIAQRSGWPRRQVYQRLAELQSGRE